MNHPGQNPGFQMRETGAGREKDLPKVPQQVAGGAQMSRLPSRVITLLKPHSTIFSSLIFSINVLGICGRFIKSDVRFYSSDRFYCSGIPKEEILKQLNHKCDF